MTPTMKALVSSNGSQNFKNSPTFSQNIKGENWQSEKTTKYSK